MRTSVASAEAPQAPLPYESIAVNLTEGDIDEAMRLYLEYISLPEEQRRAIFHFDDSQPRTGRSGYMFKEHAEEGMGGQVTDRKHTFHMSPEIVAHFGNGTVENLQLPAETRAFLDVAEEIYRQLAQSARNKYEELEISEAIPGLVGIHFPRNGQMRHKLRFLAYKDTGGGTLARGHYDKGTGTIAVAESKSGLRIGNGPEDITLLDRGNYDPIFFNSFGWHQLVEILDVEQRRRAAWHDVIDVGDPLNEETVRWALVYFLDPAAMYLESTDEQTHTPIPWRGLGQLALRSDNENFVLR